MLYGEIPYICGKIDDMNTNTLPKINIDSLKSIGDIETLDDDFAITNDVSKISYFSYPQRLETAIFALSLQGTIHFSINLERYEIGANRIVMMTPQQIIQYHEKSEDFKGIFIMINKEFIEKILPNWQIVPIYFYIMKHPCTSITDEERDRIEQCHSLIIMHLKNKNIPYCREIIENLIKVLYYEISGIFNSHRCEQDSTGTRQDEIFAKFLNYVGEHFKQERSVSFYATQMCVTPKYLSSVIKQVSNKTAGEWISDYVIFEAKTLLRTTGMSVQEISYELNFPNQSFFGKYFKERTGITPGQFRGNNARSQN